MNCRKAQSLLSAFSNEELSHSVREKLLEHLEACPGCQKKSVVARQVGEAIRHLPRRELSDDFNMRLFERIHNAPREAGVEPAHMPKAAPSALFYRLKLAAPIASIAGMLILVPNPSLCCEASCRNKLSLPAYIATVSDSSTACSSWRPRKPELP